VFHETPEYPLSTYGTSADGKAEDAARERLRNSSLLAVGCRRT
jgi:hypothetical protein